MALLTIEKIIFLNNVAIFRSMRAEDLNLVAQITKEQDFKKEDIIFNEGDYGDKMYIVIDGTVGLTKIISESKTIRVGEKRTSEFFGEMALFDDSPRSAGANCQTDLSMLVLDKNDLIELMFDYPNLSIGLISGISQALREANNRFIELQLSKSK